MKANKNETPIKIYPDIPKKWKTKEGRNIHNFHKMPESVWYEEGFRDVEIAVINPETQKLGELYFDEANDLFKRDAIDLTQEEIDAIAGSKIPSVLTASQLRQALIHQGMTPNDVKTAIETLPSPQKDIMLVRWEYEQKYNRKSEEVQQIAQILQLTTEQVNQIFTTGAEL